MPSSETCRRVRSSRTASGSEPQICSRAPVRRRISGQARSSTCSPLRVSCRPANVTVCSRSDGIDGVGDEHAVRDDLIVAREPAGRGVTCPLGDGDPHVDPAREKAPGRHRELHPAELPRSVMRRHDRCGGHREHRDTGHRCHRLVQVEHIEALPFEHAPDPEDRPRAEDDVRQRAVRRHDHGAPDRDHVGGGDAVPTDPRVERTRELPGWVIAHHQAYLVSARLQRFGLELGMLDDGAPERPRERHHDADLHAWSLFTPRSRRGARAPRSRRMRVARSSSKWSRKRLCTPARCVGRACWSRSVPSGGQLGVEPAPIRQAARPFHRAGAHEPVDEPGQPALAEQHGRGEVGHPHSLLGRCGERRAGPRTPAARGRARAEGRHRAAGRARCGRAAARARPRALPA